MMPNYNGASKQNKHEAGNDAQWPEPVGWMTPGGDISRSLKWCTDRCLPNEYRLEALYTRAQVEVMVCAQEARRVEMLRKLGARLAGLLDEDQFAECEALLLAAGVMPEENEMRKLHVGTSPLTNRIYAGHVLKDGATWGEGKQDVTGAACGAVCEHVLANGEPVMVTCNGKPKYEITVREL